MLLDLPKLWTVVVYVTATTSYVHRLKDLSLHYRKKVNTSQSSLNQFNNVLLTKSATQFLFLMFVGYYFCNWSKWRIQTCSEIRGWGRGKVKMDLSCLKGEGREKFWSPALCTSSRFTSLCYCCYASKLCKICNTIQDVNLPYCNSLPVFNFLSIKNCDEFLDILTGISDLQTLLECPVGATNIMLEDSSPNFLG